MSEDARSVQRSFRLSRRTAEMLDAAASISSESRNAIADRLLGEALRLDRHPLIRFRTGEAGRRRPMVVETRLYIYQVIATLRASRDVDEAADYFGVDPRLVRAAVEYYADFTDEVDADAAEAARVEHDEFVRWERQQRTLA